MVHSYLMYGYPTPVSYTHLDVYKRQLLHYFTKINHILLFWIAFIFTRPFGATFGDFLTKPLAKGGLDLGTLNASLVSILLMIILIIISHKKLEENI